MNPDGDVGLGATSWITSLPGQGLNRPESNVGSDGAGSSIDQLSETGE
jgi:hypothetical protein